MSLHKPYFAVVDTRGKHQVQHNCDGGINFMARDDLTEQEYRLILLALEEGKRMKAREITEALGLKGVE